ncbi:hypothetical protein [Flammeovirga agarivorans]|uniref:Uncharacterized protein n=1 Tax=Flammeovirga agarivorans TaxID=2726742 RepID=A0A7X8SRJ2_9BACT|nr:hypothetical protein [Flammeovirga agarivorans]NLR94943.1 hypothetical protein [Flammeovirga agarivorans]
MENEFLNILGSLWGTDIAYQESPETTKLILKAMEKAFALGRQDNFIQVDLQTPSELIPVLAKISHLSSLGTSEYYEVVYYSESGWNSYAGSKTFDDGEKVLSWKYCT